MFQVSQECRPLYRSTFHLAFVYETPSAADARCVLGYTIEITDITLKRQDDPSKSRTCTRMAERNKDVMFQRSSSLILRNEAVASSSKAP